MGKFQFDRWMIFAAGMGFLALAAVKVNDDNVAEAGGVAVIAALCFFFSYLARFKRWKGLGFEMELWEEKQQQAADLVERLKKVVTIYSSEAIMSKIREGRFADPNRWPAVWKLYDDLVAQHDELGQKIDFSGLKNEADTYFLFDMCMAGRGHSRIILEAWSKASGMIHTEFGPVIKDSEGHGKRLAQLREIRQKLPDQWTIAQNGNLARAILDWCADCDQKFQKYFGLKLDFDAEEMKRLERISHLWENRPVPINAETLSLSDRGDD